MNEEIELSGMLSIIKKLLKENFIILILIFIMILMYYFYLRDLAACNAHYQEILKNCIVLSGNG